jgi:SAM-dependent methyltransferase
MRPEDIGKAYDRITHLWTVDGFDRENGIAQHQRALRFLRDDSSRRGRALDVGCGCTGRFFDLLLREGLEPEGIDVSREMVRLARLRHPQLSIHHRDVCTWPIAGRYAFITAWDSLWHLPLAEQGPVVTRLLARLDPGGVLILSVGGTDAEGEKQDSVMGPEVHYATLGIGGCLRLFAEAGCLCRHLEYDQYPEPHAYFIVQKP